KIQLLDEERNVVGSNRVALLATLRRPPRQLDFATGRGAPIRKRLAQIAKRAEASCRLRIQESAAQHSPNRRRSDDGSSATPAIQAKGRGRRNDRKDKRQRNRASRRTSQ